MTKDAPLFVRNPKGVSEILAESCVGIAGCGGLGSNCAVALARSGVGKLVLVDDDRVELSNLNRQVFTRRHVGMSKALALADVIREIRDEIVLTVYEDRITDNIVTELFASCQVLIEAFDTVESKSMIMRAFMDDVFKDAWLVGASGLAGIGPADALKTHRIGRRIYVCGDLETDVAEQGVMAPRVLQVAAQQANLAVRLLCGMEPR
jgi:sulfur carrier protein ThiS adenylyltransferase